MQRKNYDLAAKIAQPLKQTLESTAPTYVLTECSACKMQIEHISDCTVLHPIKILAQTYTPA
jgi:Fe-S oxidoreductase